MTVLHAPSMALQRSTSQDLVLLRRAFASIHAESCPSTYNFHMHTNHSDGQLPPEILAKQALDIGLKGFAVTDHHQISGFYAVQAHLIELQQRPENRDKLIPQLWTGIEVTSQLLEVDVHILGYAFNPHHPALSNYLTGNAPKGAVAAADRVISAIHQAGGVAVLAHPARYRKEKAELILAAVAAGIDGVETYYAYSNAKPWKPTPAITQEVYELSQQYHLLTTCGTDTHGLNITERI